MLCLTCHQLCRENSPHPLSHTLKHINKHTHRVPFPQSASAEVTRQVAANKALRGQLQEKEDKLRQLQDKLVTSLSSLVLVLSLCDSFLLCSTALTLPFVLLHPFLRLCLSITLCLCLHICTFAAALICSV